MSRQQPALCAIHVVLPFWRAATLQRVVYATLAIGFGSSLTKLANAREEALGIHPRCCRHWQRTVHLLITLDRGGTLVQEKQRRTNGDTNEKTDAYSHGRYRGWRRHDSGTSLSICL